jgi:phage terminase large subunit-like protein
VLIPHFWPEIAHDHQLPDLPEGASTFLLVGGRGAGKTRAGAEFVRALAEGTSPLGARGAVALVAESYADAREIMIEGPSGLLALCDPGDRPEWQASRRRLAWPSGAVARCFSAEDPDGLRGFEFDAAWSDELCKWRHAEETWSNLQLALRRGARPVQAVTTTPRPTALIRRLMKSEGVELRRAATYANREHLSPVFFSEIARRYEGTRLGRQELMGELLEDVPGALWTYGGLEAARVSAAPALDRIVVAVDPPASCGADADACGIVVAGRAGQSAYVLADLSIKGASPAEWARRAVAACDGFKADRIVVEVNQGGEMARAVIAQVDPGASVRAVHATRGKIVRAEPVAALYEQGRVRHVGQFPALEDEMASFTGAGPSPDRLDALVWALTDLMLRERSDPNVRFC